MKADQKPIHQGGKSVILILFLVSMLFCFSGCRENETRKLNDKQLKAELDSILDGNVRDTKGKFIRQALLLIDTPQFNYQGAAGIARIDSGALINPEWQFYVASVGKAMTAVMIHQMDEEGVFGPKGIDATLADLDIFPPQVLAKLHLLNGVSYGESITIRHLLKQTSGLRDIFFDGLDNPVSLMPGTAEGAAPGSWAWMIYADKQLGLSSLAQCTMEGIPAGCNPQDYLFARHYPAWDYAAWQADPENKMAGLINFYLTGMNEHALWAPGEGFHYADTNYILLGLIVEKMTGNSLHQELRARIFDPLEMNSSYLINATEPPTRSYEKQLAESWAWDIPAISAGVDFSFDWGGGGIVSTLSDLQIFTRALISGKLFNRQETLAEMLAIPENIKGLHYASGMIVFPTNQGPVLYMMGSNGSWAEYYPPLDLVMVGTTNDFNNMPRQFMLHISICQALAQHGLSTPMAKIAGLPMTITGLCMIVLCLLVIIGFVAWVAEWRKKAIVPPAVKWVRLLVSIIMLVNLAAFTVIGTTFTTNPFQMLFGFDPGMRSVLVGAAILSGVLGVSMLFLIGRLWLRKEGKFSERFALTLFVIVSLACAVSLGLLGL